MSFFNSFAGLATLVTAFLGSAPTTEICHGDVGCFTNDLPCHSLDMATPETINTRFFLFTQRNRHKSQEMSWRDVRTIDASHFNAKCPTKFILHGWIENTEKSGFVHMKNAILNTEDVNVIMVDWRGGSLDVYETSVQNIRVVGRELAMMARKLHRVFKAPLSSMHAIGHSLGAHAAGYAGSELAGFGRITGMDPAGPYFRGPKLHNDCRLDRTDALFVDVIHTDGSNATSLIMGLNGLGVQEQLGHQDFYPNGGKHMPGCLPITHCSHYRAVFYFTESVATCSYPISHHCDTWDRISTLNNCTEYSGDSNRARMGYWANPRYGEGAFYLKTAASRPYC